MTEAVILKIVSEVLAIGESYKHFVCVDISTNSNTYLACAYIHSKDEAGVSAGVVDSRDFAKDSDFYLNRSWFTGWKAIIETERDDE